MQFYDENQTILLLDTVNNEVINHHFKLEQFESGSLAFNNLGHSNPLKYQVAIYIAIFCGLRNGELLGLTWLDIDFKNQTINVNKARAKTVDDGMITKLPKSNTSIRTVSIPDSLVNLLEAYRDYQEKEKEKCGDLWDEDWDNTPWLFTQWNGKGMSYYTITKLLKKTVNKYNDIN